MKNTRKTQLFTQSAAAPSSVAQYLTFVASIGADKSSVEMRYEDENIWLTQKTMAELYGVSVSATSQDIKTLTTDGETDIATIKQYLIVQFEGRRKVERKIPMSMEDWAKRLDSFLEFNGNKILVGAGKISAEQAKLHAEAQFEKYRITQDRLFESDFDRFVQLEEKVDS